MLEVGELWHQNKITVDKELLHLPTQTISLFYPQFSTSPQAEDVTAASAASCMRWEAGWSATSSYHGWGEHLCLPGCSERPGHAIGEHKPNLVPSVTMPQYLGLCHSCSAIRKAHPPLIAWEGAWHHNKIYERWPVDIHTDLATELIEWADKVVK